MSKKKKYLIRFNAWSSDKGSHVAQKVVEAVSMPDAVKNSDLHPPIILSIETWS
jgi:hypothetical protein